MAEIREVHEQRPTHSSKRSVNEVDSRSDEIDLGVDTVLPCGCTPFLLSLGLGKVEVCEFLLSKRPSLTRAGCEKNGNGADALEIAANMPCPSEILGAMISTPECPRERLAASSTKNKRGSLLHIAAQAGNEAAVSILIGAGAFIDCTDVFLCTPLHYAAQFNNAGTVRLLVAAGANTNSRGADLETPAHLAARSGATAALVELAKNFSTKLSLCDSYSNSPIQEAAANGHLDNVRTLVDYGQALDSQTERLISISARMLLLGKEKCRSFALSSEHEMAGLIPLVPFAPSSLSMVRLTTRTFSKSRLFEALNAVHSQAYRTAFAPVRALYECVVTSQFDVMKLLIDSGALINLEGGPDGTPLMAACAYGRLESVKVLVRLGAIECYTKAGVILSTIAKAQLHPDIVHWLLVGRYADQHRITSSAHEYNANLLYNIFPGHESKPSSRKKTLNLDLVLWEDWDAYLARVQPRYTRSFVCQRYGRECINHEVAATPMPAKRGLSRLSRRQSF